MSDFYRYFKENMAEPGLPTPENLFGTVQIAVATITVLPTNIDKFGKTVTVGELIGAGTSLADVLLLARTHRLDRPWLTPVLLRSPAIYRPEVAGRSSSKYIASKR